MRIAIAATGNELSSAMSFPFGRCQFFVVVEVEGDEVRLVKAVENIAQAQRGGAGITAAQLVGDEKVDAVVAGAFGPRAFGVLSELGVKMLIGAEGTVEENARKAAAGGLEEVASPGAMGPGAGKGFGQGKC